MILIEKRDCYRPAEKETGREKASRSLRVWTPDPHGSSSFQRQFPAMRTTKPIHLNRQGHQGRQGKINLLEPQIDAEGRRSKKAEVPINQRLLASISGASSPFVVFVYFVVKLFVFIFQGTNISSFAFSTLRQKAGRPCVAISC